MQIDNFKISMMLCLLWLFVSVHISDKIFSNAVSGIHPEDQRNDLRLFSRHTEKSPESPADLQGCVKLLKSLLGKRPQDRAVEVYTKYEKV